MEDKGLRAIRVKELLGPIPRAQKRAVDCKYTPAWSTGTSRLLVLPQVAAVAIAGTSYGLAERGQLPAEPSNTWPTYRITSSPPTHRSIIHLEHQGNGTAVLCQSPHQCPCVVTGKRGVSLPAVAEREEGVREPVADPAAGRCFAAVPIPIPSLSRPDRAASPRTAPRARGSAPVRAVRALLPPSVTSHAASPLASRIGRRSAQPSRLQRAIGGLARDWRAEDAGGEEARAGCAGRSGRGADAERGRRGYLLSTRGVPAAAALRGLCGEKRGRRRRWGSGTGRRDAGWREEGKKEGAGPAPGVRVCGGRGVCAGARAREGREARE